jgi:hypothetical protein
MEKILMDEDRQTLSPTEWNSVTNLVIELNQRMTEAVSSSPLQEEVNARRCEDRSIDSSSRLA